ncbi:hypothetical protein BHU72_04715 [Desulfuribacillus stibiiarsenatis]|uniref:Diguanylate cyclase response regulator n=1 Tax=Desulfuribacillus stibiiarsenatis TaxID=1390249 RepID=A0A1E5L5I5_9FIRM|nr:diguanylate cyclase [Desulfuribacillus stibiiarsenatis]OEH85395.1 hypothetical protein BHU72_04715 [Desulfuribacillus stibiiarsenatis]
MGILVIDDCKDSLQLIKAYLKDFMEEEIVTAVSAREGMELLSDEIGLILLDVVMPDKDGITACKEIKTIADYTDIPILIITQNNDLETLEKAFQAGASDFIRKPFHKLELRARVSAFLKLSREMKHRKLREQELVSLNQELYEKNELLKQLSMIDGLTGIANRRYFNECLDREWKLAVRNHTPLSVVIFDVDHFKDYNDQYGHQSGDEVLKNVAAAAVNVIKRPTDIIARYGGEEFVVILPETTCDGGYHVAETIRKEIIGLNICHEKSSVCESLTVSVGVAEIGKHGDTMDCLIERADKALYQAKQLGRNRTIRHSDIENAKESTQETL